MMNKSEIETLYEIKSVIESALVDVDTQYESVRDKIIFIMAGDSVSPARRGPADPRQPGR